MRWWLLGTAALILLLGIGAGVYFMSGGRLAAVFGGAAHLTPRQKDGTDLWGYVDDAGGWVIEPRFRFAGEFGEVLEDHALVASRPTGAAYPIGGDALMLIDRSGKVSADLSKFTRIEAFSEGLAAAQTGSNSWGYVDPAGKLVAGGEYLEAGPFRQGVARVKVKLDLSGFSVCTRFIDPQGKTALGTEAGFAAADDFAEGWAAVQYREDGQWALIDRQGQPVLKGKYTRLRSPHQGLSVAAITLPPPRAFADGETLYGYVTPDGREVVRPQFVAATDFSEGLAAVQKGERWGFVDTQGVTVIPCQYVNVLPFADGLAAVYESTFRFGFVDKGGNPVISMRSGHVVSSFRHGRAKVSRSSIVGLGPYEYLDRTGKSLVSPP